MRTLPSWFAESARLFPDEVALVVAGRRMTYRQLDRAAGVVRRELADLSTRGSGRIGLLAARSLTAYAGYLGVMRGGNAVVPMNVDYPPERNRQVAELAELDALVVDEGREVPFADALDLPVLRLEDDALEAAAQARDVDGDGAAWSDDPDSVAYLLFTSGSTGVPKGVPIRHRNVDQFLRHHLARYDVGPGARMSQTFGLTFDPSVFDMFVAWGSGAALVVPSRAELLDPISFVNEQAITHWYSVPSIVSWVHEAASLTPGSLPTLRHSLFAGEQFTLAQARAWSDAAPNSTIDNLYGPTELTVTVTAYRLPAEREAWPVTPNATVPIGQIYPHLEHRVDAGSSELLIRGPQRFDGYLDPADNDGRFVAADGSEPTAGQPLGDAAWYRTGDRVVEVDGSLVHLGRLDDQVKILGRRLELGDVESALRRWAGLGDLVVTAAPGPTGDVRLTAVYTGEPVATRELRARLMPHLPIHMIPARFVHVDALPTNANGKIDRRACREL